MTYVPEADSDPSGAPAESERATSRRALGCAFEVIETLVLTLLIYLVIHNFVAQPFEVQQSSMFPTIVDGEYILIDKLTPRFNGYNYGDIIVFNPPSGSGLGADGVPFIKRVIGLPGDTISLENGRVFVTQPGGLPIRIEEPYVLRRDDGSTAPTDCPRIDCPMRWIVGPNEVFVMGDNRPSSQDSRVFGPIEEDQILGRAWLRYFPLDRIGLFERPTYPALERATPAG
ncbi:MAG: signal peptidase I [Chloroflexi bacterium]|nr:signal peptidase I [Chloroflexota bacterium]